MTTTPHAIDELTQLIDQLRPRLERSLPIKTRIRVLWAAAKNARGLAAIDVLQADFLQLAHDTGLTADLGAHADQTLRHVLGWAARGMNPFETGPLQ
jgi:hypothetical protein